MAGKRRSMENAAPVSRSYIVGIVDRIDTVSYGVSVSGGLSIELQRIRNKALVSFLYESARRVSEIVGRTYHDDTWRGLELQDIRYDTLAGVDVMIVSCRILKKGSIKHGLREKYGDVILDMGDTPFIEHIEEWFEYLRGFEVQKLFSLSQSGIYRILQRINPNIVGPHWFRHMRLSHLAETLTPYQLNARIGYWESLDPAVSYVHGRVSDYLKAVRLSRETN